MKKLIIFLLVWVIAVVSGIVGVKVYKQHQISKYAVDAVPYVKKVIPEISQWDPVAIRSLMTEQTLQSLSPEKFSRIIEIFSQMGELQSMEEPVFVQTDSLPTAGGGNQMLVRYTVKARYRKGDAILTLNLVEEQGGFRVAYFNLSSEVLTQQ
ncbi:hypothetical protein [Geothermobacter hydrogeniphilus]|uniref:hypothetical protein n=1 Tax=Geothermobacter hydrogeniphilus TaxID=1969733 RepID=UPI0011AF5865|nr:hypothetical protein [Geothermobacter hydrogeniphilus]